MELFFVFLFMKSAFEYSEENSLKLTFSLFWEDNFVITFRLYFHTCLHVPYLLRRHPSHRSPHQCQYNFPHLRHKNDLCVSANKVKFLLLPHHVQMADTDSNEQVLPFEIMLVPEYLLNFFDGEISFYYWNDWQRDSQLLQGCHQRQHHSHVKDQP